MEPWHLALSLFVMPALTALGVWLSVRSDRRQATEALIAQGKHVQRVEAAAAKIEKIEDRLDRIPQIEQSIVFVREQVARLRSDHDELSEKVASTRERLASIHDD